LAFALHRCARAGVAARRRAGRRLRPRRPRAAARSDAAATV